MKSSSSREQRIKELNSAVQVRGNLSILFTNALTEQIGLSATEFECIDIISGNQPLTAGRLAVLTGLSTGGVTGVVDRLERAGFVRRVRDGVDRRRVLIELKPNKKAWRRISELYQPLSVCFDKLVGTLNDHDLSVILNYERQSIAMLHELLGHDSPEKTPRYRDHEEHTELAD